MPSPRSCYSIALFPTDYPFVCKINQYVDGDHLIIRAGCLRNMPVSIGGTTWKPDMPMESQIREQMGEIKQFLYEDCIDGIAFEPLPGQEVMEEPER